MLVAVFVGVTVFVVVFDGVLVGVDVFVGVSGSGDRSDVAPRFPSSEQFVHHCNNEYGRQKHESYGRGFTSTL